MSEENKNVEYKKKKHRKHKKKIKNKALRVTIVIIICFLILGCMGYGTYEILKYIGNKNLEKQATTVVPSLPPIVSEAPEPIEEVEEELVLEDGQVLYNDQVYQYNSDIKTFVLLGIDTMGTVKQLIKEEMGGQSDLIMLGVLNPHSKKIQIIAINRNTMADIQRFDVAGNYYDTTTAQITLQHAYGTGGADSCEKTVAAIDNLMYMIPIHGYYSMNMGAISKLNDAVGGVTVTALEDVITDGTKIKAGEKRLLLGKDAFYYTKYRDWRVEGTADRRLERQKQYLTEFIKKMKVMVKDNKALPIDLYKIVAEYSVTDLSLDEVTYLASTAASYSFDSDDIYTLPGHTEHNGEYAEYYVDEEALYKLIIDIFYEPVNK